MNWNSLVRRTHRWLSIAFTAGVIQAACEMAQAMKIVDKIRVQRVA